MIRNHNGNHLRFYPSFNLFMHLFILENTSWEQSDKKKKGKTRAFLLETEIFSGSAGLVIDCEAKFLDKTSLVHIVIENKIILPLAHLQEAALRK